MTTKTVAGATDILTVAQNILKDGRPRKPLGKPRPQHNGHKMSLVGALKYARLILGATRRQYEAALETLDDEAFYSMPTHKRWYGAPTALAGVEQYDEVELDTRQIIRTIDKAKKVLAEQ